MNVLVYDFDAEHGATYRTTATLRDLFDDAEYHTARRELIATGEYLMGTILLVLPKAGGL
jgi:hypothetical protein